MRASRGMGDINPSKMPNKPKVITRKDDPNKVDFAIPANDDATKSIAIIVNYITAAIAEGLQERQADKDEDDNSDVEESAEAKAARFEERVDGGDDKGKRSRGAGSAAPAKRRPASAGAGRRPAGK